jgi:hypothetical protein
MTINEGKSTLTTYSLSEMEKNRFRLFFPFEEKSIDEGLKYLGFSLKPNDYRKEDWTWLLKKLEKRLSSWSHKWLSRAGRLVLVKSVLEAIPIFWMSLSWIPKGTLEAARKLSFRFLWSGKKDTNVTPWVRWKRIAVPKALGGWGLKNIHVFSKALAAKGGWSYSLQTTYGQRLSLKSILNQTHWNHGLDELRKLSKEFQRFGRQS